MDVCPACPSFAEQGDPSLEALSWMGLWCPPDVPAAQDRVHDAAPAVHGRLWSRLGAGYIGRPPQWDAT